MGRRKPSRQRVSKPIGPQPRQEPEIVTAANPTEQQRARFDYREDKTINPHGAAVTITQDKVEVHTHKVCRRQPVYVTLHNRKGICDRTRAVLDWYDARLALARKGLTVDSLARANGLGGGNGKHTPSDAAADARSDVDWARGFIQAGLNVFDQVMEHELSFTTIGGGNNRMEERARTEFKLAANWLLLGAGSRVLAC